MQKAKIIVAVRKRPLFQKQKSKGYTDIINVNNGNRVIVSQMKQKVDLTKYMQESVFNFDHAFDENNTNEDIYSVIISPLIDSAFQGAKVSCFAYGQTGSGKTYTMNGVMSKNIPGLYTLGAYDIFQKLQNPEFSHLSVYLSFYEIYCTKLYDLLNKRNQLILRQDAKSNINVVGLSQIPISNVQQFQSYLKTGSSQRVTSQNSANSESSRSHAILQISLKSGKKPFGKVYFIDLAGNQRGADHANQKKQTQIDGQQINKSLLQLKQCIRGLDQGKNHVPFRGSKLTMCLKDSFIGFCRTVMIGNISPCSASSQNTLNTLRYADRVKQLKNNEELTKEQLKSRQMMLPRGNNNAIKIKISDSDDQDDIAEKKRKALEQYGIRPEEKIIPSKEDNNRKLSMGTSGSSMKPIQINKSSSISKNPVVNSINNISNKNIPLQRTNEPKLHSQIQRKQTLSLKNQVPEYLNRLRNNRIEQIGQPMQIQMQENTFNNNNKLRNNYFNQNQNNSQIYPGQQQQVFKNYSQIQQQPHYVSQNNFMNNNSRVGMNNNSNINQNYQQLQMQNNQRHNIQQNYPNQDFNHNINNQNINFNQNISQINNRNSNNSNNSNNGYSIGQNNSFMQQKNMNNNNMMINEQQNYSHNNNHNNFNINNHNNRINKRQPVPQNWNQIIDCIQNTNNSQFQSQLHQKLISNLFQQQNQLINQHSNTLQLQIQKIKQEMEVIKVIEHDRSALSSKQYAKIMYDSIDQKMSQLEMLKEKLANFMYKLDDIDEVQKKMETQVNKKQSLNQDQQLLEDYY